MATKLHQLEQEYILENYPKFGLKAVAEKLNRSIGAVSKFAKEHNLKIGNKKDVLGVQMPEFNLDMLDFSKRFNILNKELCYWLGYFWADGTITGNSLVIEITEEDGEDIRSLFSSIYPFRISKRYREGRKPQMSFAVVSKEISSLLKSLGKYPKSSEDHQKIYDYINDINLFKYFIRGLIDGDGNFYINEKDHYIQFTIASNIDQDWTCLSTLLSEFSPRIVKDEGVSGKSSVLRITGKENIIKLIHFLGYIDDSIGLQRKYQKVLKILDEFSEPLDNKKHIFQYSLDNNFIKEYKSLSEIVNEFGFKRSAILNCLNGYSKSSHGYIWSYEKK